jgi:hypothetical protein
MAWQYESTKLVYYCIPKVDTQTLTNIAVAAGDGEGHAADCGDEEGIHE